MEGEDLRTNLSWRKGVWCDSKSQKHLKYNSNQWRTSGRPNNYVTSSNQVENAPTPYSARDACFWYFGKLQRVLIQVITPFVLPKKFSSLFQTASLLIKKISFNVTTLGVMHLC